MTKETKIKINEKYMLDYLGYIVLFLEDKINSAKNVYVPIFEEVKHKVLDVGGFKTINILVVKDIKLTGGKSRKYQNEIIAVNKARIERMIEQINNGDKKVFDEVSEDVGIGKRGAGIYLRTGLGKSVVSIFNIFYSWKRLLELGMGEHINPALLIGDVLNTTNNLINDVKEAMEHANEKMADEYSKDEYHHIPCFLGAIASSVDFKLDNTKPDEELDGDEKAIEEQAKKDLVAAYDNTRTGMDSSLSELTDKVAESNEEIFDDNFLPQVKDRARLFTFFFTTRISMHKFNPNHYKGGDFTPLAMSNILIDESDTICKTNDLVDNVVNEKPRIKIGLEIYNHSVNKHFCFLTAATATPRYREVNEDGTPLYDDCMLRGKCWPELSIPLNSYGSGFKEAIQNGHLAMIMASCLEVSPTGEYRLDDKNADKADISALDMMIAGVDDIMAHLNFVVRRGYNGAISVLFTLNNVNNMIALKERLQRDPDLRDAIETKLGKTFRVYSIYSLASDEYLHGKANKKAIRKMVVDKTTYEKGSKTKPNVELFTRKRQRWIDDINNQKEGVNIILHCRTLFRAVNIQSIVGVYFMKPEIDGITLQQMIGRGTRVWENKLAFRLGYVCHKGAVCNENKKKIAKLQDIAHMLKATVTKPGEEPDPYVNEGRDNKSVIWDENGKVINNHIEIEMGGMNNTFFVKAETFPDIIQRYEDWCMEMLADIKAIADEEKVYNKRSVA